MAGAVNAFQYYTKSITVKSGGTLTTKDGITSNIGAGGATTTLTLEGGATLSSGTPDSSWGSWTLNMGTSLVAVSGGNAAPAVVSAVDVTIPSARSPLTFNVSNVTGDASPDLIFTGTMTTKGGANYGISKTGQGTMVLSGVNTYNGATTVSGGTLQVEGAIGAGAVTVYTTATLAGSGTIGGVVTAQSGATLAPGGSQIGTLATGAEVWNGGAALAFGLADAVASAGWDRLAITGTLNIQASAASKFVVKLLSLSTTNAPGPVPNFNKFSSYVWTLAAASGGIQNFDPSKFALDTSGFNNDFSGGTFAVEVSGNALALRYAAAPKIAPRFTDITAQMDGSISLSCAGTPGEPYILLTASNLTSPGTWIPSASNYADANGAVSFSDATTTNTQQRFYRLFNP